MIDISFGQAQYIRARGFSAESCFQIYTPYYRYFHGAISDTPPHSAIPARTMTARAMPRRGHLADAR